MLRANGRRETGIVSGVKKPLRYAFFALLALVLIAGAAILSREPRGDREWVDEFVRTPTAWENGIGVFYIRNVRDWTYGTGSVLSKDWIDEVEADPRKITRAWFMEEPFPSWSAVGHTYLSFEFNDGTALSFSVEARMQKGQNYSALRGLFQQYELTYSWGTERDFLARRILLLGHSVRMYPLAIEPDVARALFRALAEKTTELAGHPRFYNTLTANCTNILAEIVNGAYPESIPYDISWNFPGSSDSFLMSMGYIRAEGSVEEERSRHDLGQYREEIAHIATSDQKMFSGEIRTLLERVRTTSSPP